MNNKKFKKIVKKFPNSLNIYTNGSSSSLNPSGYAQIEKIDTQNLQQLNIIM